MNLHVWPRIRRRLRTLRAAAAIVLLPLVSAMSCEFYEELAAQRLIDQYSAAKERVNRGIDAAIAAGCESDSVRGPRCAGIDPARVRDAFALVVTGCIEILALSAQAQRARERLPEEHDVYTDLWEPSRGKIGRSYDCRTLLSEYRNYDPEGYQAALAAGRQDASSGGPGTSVDLEPRSSGGPQTSPAAGGSPGGGGGGDGGGGDDS